MVMRMNNLDITTQHCWVIKLYLPNSLGYINYPIKSDYPIIGLNGPTQQVGLSHSPTQLLGKMDQPNRLG